MQIASQIVTINKPTPSVLQAACPFLSENQQHQSTEGKKVTEFAQFIQNNKYKLSKFKAVSNTN